MNLAIIGSESSLTYSDNAMAHSANASDKAKVSSLESENGKLETEVSKLTSENQSLQTQISQFQSATKVDISSDMKERRDTKEVSDETKQYLSKNNVNMANESANFTKQNIQSQAGSMTLALANPNAGSVQRLVS
jgi:predicted RNase H-like nuclease (RuvC/YqgF family)